MNAPTTSTPKTHHDLTALIGAMEAMVEQAEERGFPNGSLRATVRASVALDTVNRLAETHRLVTEEGAFEDAARTAANTYNHTFGPLWVTLNG